MTQHFPNSDWKWTDWLEDDDLGIAVREVHGELQVRPLSLAGARRIQDAGNTAYRTSARVRFPSEDVIAIDSAHRLAFARALSAMFCERYVVDANGELCLEATAQPWPTLLAGSQKGGGA